MRNVLGRILSHCSNKFSKFILQIDGVVNEITTVRHEVGFEGLDKENMNELLKCHSEELDEADLFNIDSQRAYEESDDEKPILSLSRKVTQKQFANIFCTLETLKQHCIDVDSDLDRRAQICRDLNSALAPSNLQKFTWSSNLQKFTNLQKIYKFTKIYLAFKFTKNAKKKILSR